MINLTGLLLIHHLWRLRLFYSNVFNVLPYLVKFSSSSIVLGGWLDVRSLKRLVLVCPVKVLLVLRLCIEMLLGNRRIRLIKAWLGDDRLYWRVVLVRRLRVVTRSDNRRNKEIMNRRLSRWLVMRLKIFVRGGIGRDKGETLRRPMPLCLVSTILVRVVVHYYTQLLIT